MPTQLPFDLPIWIDADSFDWGSIGIGTDSGGGGGSTGSGGGGATTDAPAPVPDEFTELNTDESGTLAVAYGMHLVRGNLILSKRTEGPPPTHIVFSALGEGEWDGVEKVWYAGEELDPSEYSFHPGNQSVNTSDPTQGIDAFYPTGITYSGTAYIAVELPERFATEDRPDKIVGLYTCLKVPDYNAVGVQTDAGSYSANPARCAAHAILVRAELPTDRIDWPSWYAFKTWCDEDLSWDNDGDASGNITINRAECHVAFLQPTDLATALDAICATAGAIWQDDGRRIKFILPTDQTIRHHFTDGLGGGIDDGLQSNIVDGSFNFYPREVRERPNRIQAVFRDLRDEYLTEATEESIRETAIDRVGVIDGGSRYLGNMNHAQAQRLLERMMRIEFDNPILAELRGLGDSFHVLPGDYVTVSHEAASWSYVRCIVLEASEESAEETADERSFVVQRIDDVLYKDADMRPIQAAVAP